MTILKYGYLLLMLLLAACSSLAPPGTSGHTEPPTQVLLITGGGWHDYEAQERLLTEGLSARIPNTEWTIVHEGNGEPDHQSSILQQDDWAAEYDVVIHNTGFGRVTDSDFVEQFVANHRGTPAVLIHSAVHSYRYADPGSRHWFRLSGVQSMGHEKERRLTVENMAPEDPVMANFPTEWQTPVTDELYVVEQIWGDIRPLARAYGTDTEQYQPVIWKHQLPDTRVFATTLGHNSGMFEQPVYLDMLARGVLWALGRPVDSGMD